VPAGDWAALAAAIGEVLADEPLRQQLATAAQHRARLEDAAATARLFEALYRQACASARCQPGLRAR
jgi:hypothetical protein